MSEIIFVIEEAPEGGFTARALRESIFAEADDLKQLEADIRHAVQCHFADDERPKMIRLHYVRDHLLAVGGFLAMCLERTRRTCRSRAMMSSEDSSRSLAS